MMVRDIIYPMAIILSMMKAKPSNQLHALYYEPFFEPRQVAMCRVLSIDIFSFLVGLTVGPYYFFI